MANKIWIVVLDWFEDIDDEMSITKPNRVIPCDSAETALDLFHYITGSQEGYELYDRPKSAYIYKTTMATHKNIHKKAGWSDDERYWAGKIELSRVIKD